MKAALGIGLAKVAPQLPCRGTSGHGLGPAGHLYSLYTLYILAVPPIKVVWSVMYASLAVTGGLFLMVKIVDGGNCGERCAGTARCVASGSQK